MKNFKKWYVMLCILLLGGTLNAQRQMENLDRGLVAVKVSSGVYLSWRILGTEFTNTSYNLYRNGTLITTVSNTGASNYSDASGTTSSTYYIKAVVGGVEQTASTTVSVMANIYKQIALSVPAGGTTPDGVAYTYSANDCSVGDLNGDGQYEIIVKWDPSNSKDNSLSGYTGDVFLDAYTLSGTMLWRIDLGKNIRAGAHYTQFLVYDFDGDGKAEVVCKTAPGTKDGTGAYLTGAAAGTDNSADYRNSSGYILTGPEYLTIFNGPSGKELQTINYEVARGTVSSWGDSYGNRVDRFLACVAYLDGKTPSIVMCRGYYTRCYLVAYKWNGSALAKQWAFDSNTSGNSGYAGQGCHSLNVADVDGDGYDEIIYGACCIDHNGAGKYTTGLGHGDALHTGVFDPSRSGYQVWQAHEDGATNGGIGATFRDANTGAVIWKFGATGDVGRGMAADLTSAPGVECWAAGTPNLYTAQGGNAGSNPSSDNFACWWDGDDYRELLDGTSITKYGGSTLLTASGCSSNNSTKSNPCLSADIFGDWREEVIWRTTDSKYLNIYTTTTPTTRRLYTLMHDKMYRLGIAWQNVAYNQPPDVSFFLGNGMSTPPTPNITLVGSVTPTTYSLTTSVSGSGSISPANGSYNANTVVSLTATPSSGYQFSGWSGDASGTSNPLSVTMNSNKNITATFTLTGSNSLIYEAENATISLAVTETVNAGYSGASYVNTNNVINSYIEWTVTPSTAGSYTLEFRHANGTTTDRPASVSVNGTIVISSLSFPGTGAFTTWVLTPKQTVTLNAAANKIRLTATTANGCSNIDYLQVSGSGTLKMAQENAIRGISGLIIYPNPVNGGTSPELKFSLDTRSDVKILVLNNLGKVVYRKDLGILHAGEVSQTLDLTSLAKGTYIIKVGSKTAKLIRL